jgi:predicted metal-dependent phosphoesterase TrpH
MRCDLHVHSRYSGMCTVPLLDRICRESYTPPAEAYEALKRQGMDLVTITDHDSIGSIDELGHFPDFFLSEEVSVTLVSGTRAHVGVYDLNERQHLEIQRRRDDCESFLAYLAEQELLFSINHVFSSLTGPRTAADFDLFLDRFPAMETRNAAMLAAANRSAGRLAARWGKPGLGGSDSHALGSVGRAFTEVRGARTKQEFLRGVREGRATVEGSSGGYFLLTAEVLSIVKSLLKERPAAWAISPLLAFLPLVLLLNYGKEIAFAHFWRSRLVPQSGLRTVPEVAG